LVVVFVFVFVWFLFLFWFLGVRFLLTSLMIMTTTGRRFKFTHFLR